MLRDFWHNFVTSPWRLDIMPHLSDLKRSPLFWAIVALLLAFLLIHHTVRKR
jgi:hypothetical protein